MPRKSYKPEEIVAKLRQVDVLTSQGRSVAEAIRSIGVSEVTYYLYGRLSLCKTGIMGFSDPWQTSIRRHRSAQMGNPHTRTSTAGRPGYSGSSRVGSISAIRFSVVSQSVGSFRQQRDRVRQSAARPR